MNENRVEIIITTDDSGAVVGYKSIGDIHTKTMDKMKSDTASATSFIKQNWLALTAGVVAGMTAWRIAGEAFNAILIKTADAGEQIKKLSEQTGIGAQRISELKYAAELSEASIDALSTGLGLFSRSIYKATDETPQAQAAFKALGVATRDVSGNIRQTYDVLMDVADRFSHMEDGAGKAALAMAMFGRGGRELIPLLNEGRQGIRDMGDEAKRLGITFTGDTANAADEFGDNLKRLKANATGLAQTLGNELIPKLNDLFEIMQQGTKVRLSAQLADIDSQIEYITKGRESWSAKFQRAIGLGYVLDEDNKILQGKMKERQDILDKLWDMQQPKRTQGKTPAPELPDIHAGQQAKDLAAAMVDWNSKINVLNPNLNETTKEIQALTGEADKLKQKWGNAGWIAEGLSKGTAAILAKQKTDFEALSIEFQSSMQDGRAKDLADNDQWLYQQALKFNNNQEDITKLLAMWSQKRAKIEEQYINELTLARANAAEKDLESQMSIEDKLNQYRVQAGDIGEETAVIKRYEGERNILAVKQSVILTQMTQEKNEAKFLELQQQYYDIDKQIAASDKSQVYEVDEVKRKNLQDFLSLEKQRLDIQKEQYAAAWQNVMDQANQIGGEVGKGMGTAAANIKGITDIGMGVDPWSKELQQKVAHYEQMEQLTRDWKNREAVMNQEYDNLILAQDQASAQQRMSIAANLAGALSGTMYALYAASGQQSKAMFAMYKTFAIAEALISTYAGAARALKDFPWPISLVVAGIVTAAGIARVASIAAQQPGGATSGAGASGGGGYKYTEPTAPQYTQQPQAQPKPVTQNIYIYSNVMDSATLDDIARQLTPALNKAQQDGAH